jgi:hypothetical protein
VIPCDELAVQLLQHLAIAHEGARAPGGQLRVDVPPPIRETLLRSLGDPRGFATRNSRALARKAAASLGIGVPVGIPVPYMQAAETFAAEHGWPVVLKRDRLGENNGVRLCASTEELRTAYAGLTQSLDTGYGLVDRARYLAWSVLSGFHLAGDLCRPRDEAPSVSIEVHVAGRPACYAVCAYEGRLLAGIAAIADAVYPEPIGQPSLVRLVRDPTMAEAARRMVARVGFTGFGGVDFMRDETTGKLWFNKFDPRPTPLAHLGHLAGGDLCTPLMAAVSGTHPVPQRGTKETTVALFPQDWARDPDATERGAEHLDVPEDDPRLLAALKARIPGRLAA